MNGLLRSGSNRTDWVNLLIAFLRFTGVASWLPADDSGHISLISQSSGIDNRDAQSDTNSIDVIPGVDVVERHDNEIELSKEWYFQLLDIGVIGVNLGVAIQSQNWLPSHQGFRHSFVLSLE